MTGTLGATIKAARLSRGKTQEETAAGIGIARPSLAQWEGGRTNPSIQNLQKLCGFLGISLPDLMAGTVTPHGEQHEDVPGDAAELERTLGLIRKAAERDIGFSPTSDQALRWLVKKAGLLGVVFAERS
jgi:transcriptional regulator with XRE-family HTH domain